MQTALTTRRRPSRAELILREDVARHDAYLSDRRAKCPRTVEVLDAAWSRLDRELDEGLRAWLSDLIFMLGVYEGYRNEITEEDADQVFLFLISDLR